MSETTGKSPSIYRIIYDIVSLIPAGKVASYGQIARIAGNCTPRMVGYAMAALPENSKIPWQRIVNSQGKISIRSDGNEDGLQKQLLIAEGVKFGNTGRIDLQVFGWPRPDVNKIV